MTKQQTVFCPGCKQTVRLIGSFSNQIINQYSNIALRTIENHRFFLLHFAGSINTGHYALSCRFLISGCTIDLTGSEETRQTFGFE
ncbi:hypothetical protein D3C80_1659890 [compost metagenome]